MPKCKNCGMSLSRLDKDVCPFCGTLKPIDGQENVTEDITKAFDPVRYELQDVKQKSRVAAGLLAIFLGPFGAHAFYLGKKLLGLILLLITLALVGGVGSALFFSGVLPNALAFVIPYLLMEVSMIVVGIVIFKRRDETDANGELLK